MIITRSPLRVSFGGGGTDIETYYKQFGGYILSTTIDKYFYSFLYPCSDGAIEIVSTDYKQSGLFLNWQSIPNCEAYRLLKAVLDYFDWPGGEGFRITMASEVPSGTGLGSSCAVSVNLVNILASFLGKQLSKKEIAEAASYVDTRILKLPIGKQDQYASSFGGLNIYEFSPNGVIVTPLEIAKETKSLLDKRIMLFFGGKARSSSSILTEQKEKSKADIATIEVLNNIKENAMRMTECLKRNDLDEFGELLHQSWLSKKRLHRKVTNDDIDLAYETARNSGALGGKVAGAGGGGFLIIYCYEAHQRKVRKELAKLNWRQMNFSFEEAGSTVLYKD